MGFFMSEINFCNTKEQLNHLGEVVTGKTNGSQAGADIDTSTLPYTGQVRKTLPALEAEYLEAIRNAGGEPLNGGLWAAGQTFTAYNQYMVYNGVPYKPLTTTTLPYGPTGSTPDFNFVQPYVDLSSKDVDLVFSTLSDALASIKVTEGQRVRLVERTSGNGGGANWNVVLTSSVTPNTFNIVQSTATPTLSLVLEEFDSVVYPDQWGDANDMAALQAAINYAGSFTRWKSLIVSHRYNVTQSLIVDRPVDTMLAEWRVIGVGGNAGFYTALPIKIFDSSLSVTTAPLSEWCTFERILFEKDSVFTNARCFSEKFLRMKFINCEWRLIGNVKSSIYTQTWYYVAGCNIRNHFTTATGAAPFDEYFHDAPSSYDTHVTGFIIENGARFLKSSNPSDPRGTNGLYMTDGVCEGQDGHTVFAQQLSGCGFKNIHIEVNSAANFNFNADPTKINRGVSVENCHIISTTDNIINDPNFCEIIWGNTVGGKSSGNYTNGRLNDQRGCTIQGIESVGDSALVSIFLGYGGVRAQGNNSAGLFSGYTDRSLTVNEGVAFTGVDGQFQSFVYGGGVASEDLGAVSEPCRLFWGSQNPQSNPAFYGNRPFRKGSKMNYLTPASGGKEGLVCVSSGDGTGSFPCGLWLEFGSIA